MENRIVKIGNIEILEQEARELYQKDMYIVTYRSIFEIFYSASAGVYGRKIYYAERCNHPTPLTKRGRFFTMSGKSVNELLGFRLVLEN